MVALISLVSIALIGSAAALPPALPTKKTGCGEVNVVLTGLPPNHPTVIAQGYDPKAVDAGLKADGANVIKAGYNYMLVLLGPEVDEPATLGKKLEGTMWSVAATGFGVRGSNTTELTYHMEKTLQLFREKAPGAALAFNRSPVSTLEAIQRWAPLSSDCADSPGKDLGSETFCDATVCTQSF
ncbi:hypothetical protein K505DRAFT_363639 [Melanomma pulvis-pyrius CBS 109.77]|uniref:Carbohydrate esterase family 5 protein n=1 Tax=Melanomma pulvis-pyrius CBS 109.77 TaxID=1314802 RepID=A0A6A6X5L1_9PLEO|nr:hypothetical protein K505DRAFT_363639 [Melanomma pulvis-pyrius CBS 109.77]